MGYCKKCNDHYSLIRHNFHGEQVGKDGHYHYSEGVCQYTEECKTLNSLTSKCMECDDGFSVANYDLRICIENEKCKGTNMYGICN